MLRIEKHFVVKDSGKRQEWESGMVRDTQDNKTRFHLVFDGPMLERFAQHLTKGAIKYRDRNWMLAQSPEEMERYKESAVRHFFQWMAGDTDEDHAAAIFFNINGYEYVKARIEEKKKAASEEAAGTVPLVTSGSY